MRFDCNNIIIEVSIFRSMIRLVLNKTQQLWKKKVDERLKNLVAFFSPFIIRAREMWSSKVRKLCYKILWFYVIWSIKFWSWAWNNADLTTSHQWKKAMNRRKKQKHKCFNLLLRMYLLIMLLVNHLLLTIIEYCLLIVR